MTDLLCESCWQDRQIARFQAQTIATLAQEPMVTRAEAVQCIRSGIRGAVQEYRPPSRCLDCPPAKCADCGVWTTSGIYVRRDPIAGEPSTETKR